MASSGRSRVFGGTARVCSSIFSHPTHPRCCRSIHRRYSRYPSGVKLSSPGNSYRFPSSTTHLSGAGHRVSAETRRNQPQPLPPGAPSGHPAPPDAESRKPRLLGVYAQSSEFRSRGTSFRRRRRREPHCLHEPTQLSFNCDKMIESCPLERHTPHTDPRTASPSNVLCTPLYVLAHRRTKSVHPLSIQIRQSQRRRSGDSPLHQIALCTILYATLLRWTKGR
jgi:hypothetical protein